MSIISSVRAHWRANRGETCALAALAVGAAALVAVAWRASLPLPYQIVLWGVWLAGTVVVGRLFGPVLYYDLVRSARRLRFVAVRTAYAVVISFMLGWLFWILHLEYGGNVPPGQMPEFANGFFYTFLVIQYLTVVLLTPAYTAGAIAEEKERKTLEFILATDLGNREIVLGKAVSRLLNLTLLILAGVPILSCLQFLGGVDFSMVLAGFAATAVTMYSMAGLSMLNSVLCRRARDAIVMTYMMAVAYGILATGSWMTMMWATRGGGWPELASWPSQGTFVSPVELQDVVNWFNSGNVIVAIFRLGSGASATAVFEQELPAVLGGYALFHALAGTTCLVWAVLRLRALGLREDVRAASRKKGRRAAGGPKPRVGRHAMVWKEVFAEGGLRLNALGRIVAGVLVIASFLPAIYLLCDHVYETQLGGFVTPWEEVRRAMNAVQMRFVGTVVAVLMLLAVVVRAAGSVHSERERNTLDELLTTRLTNNEILFGKWLGAVLSVRWGWAWLGLIWLVSLVMGGVQWYALPLLVVSWLVYATVGAGVGMWFSIGGKTTLRATVWSLAAIVLLFGGHWLATGMFCYLPMGALGIPESTYEWMLYLQSGQTPPWVLGFFAFSGEDFTRNGDLKWVVRMTMACLFGVGVWAALVPVLWLLVRRRFEQVTGRVALLRPERVMPRRRKAEPKRALLIDAEPPEGEQILTALPADEKDSKETR